MGHWGGSQPNAGRKPGSKSKKTIAQELALEELRKKIREHWDALFEAKLDLAKGLFYERKNPLTGTTKVYKKAPDGQSIEYLFSMVVGKPKDIMEVGTKDGLPIELKISLDESIKKIYGKNNGGQSTSNRQGGN